jgi:hypothetical protein
VLAQADQKRRAHARDHHALLVPLVNDGDCVCAIELRDAPPHGLQQSAARPRMRVDEVRDDFRIGLGGELVSLAAKHATHLVVVLDDPVVHDGDSTAHVRVGIGFGGLAVRGPSRVGDADVAVQAVRAHEPLERCHAPGAPQALQLAVHHGDAGRVVAAILEALQSLDEDGNHVAPCDGADDAAHDQSPVTRW